MCNNNSNRCCNTRPGGFNQCRRPNHCGGRVGPGDFDRDRRDRCRRDGGVGPGDFDRDRRDRCRCGSGVGPGGSDRDRRDRCRCGGGVGPGRDDRWEKDNKCNRPGGSPGGAPCPYTTPRAWQNPRYKR